MKSDSKSLRHFCKWVEKQYGKDRWFKRAVKGEIDFREVRENTEYMIKYYNLGCGKSFVIEPDECREISNRLVQTKRF